MKKIIYGTALAVVFSVPFQQAIGQTLSDQAKNGSVYSNIGVGVPLDRSSSSANGMGGLGVSFFESDIPGLANPAEWGNTSLGVASGSVSLQQYDASDNSGSSINTNFAIEKFQIQLPVKPRKVGVSVSFAPLTRSNYRLIEQQSIPADSGVQLVEIQNRGSGGVNSFEIGVGWRINNTFSVGYAGSVVFATISNEITALFENSDAYQATDYTLKTNGAGIGNRFGTQVSIPFNTTSGMVFGAAVELPVKLKSERVLQSDVIIGITGQGNPIVETTIVDEGAGLGDETIKLPAKFTGGVTYLLNRSISLTAEGLYQQWSDFEYNFSPTEENYFTDRYKGILGLRYFPFSSGSNNFFSRMEYRAGVSYDTGHLEIAGQNIETLLFSAGIGVPSPTSNSSFDISLHYGIRGTKDQNIVKESIWGLKLSVNLAELMFVRSRLQ